MDTLDESVQSIDGTSGKLMFIKKGFVFKCLMVCNDSQFPSYTKLGSLSPICLYRSPFLSEMMQFINVASTTARRALWQAGTMVPSVPQTTSHMLSYAPAHTQLGTSSHNEPCNHQKLEVRYPLEEPSCAWKVTGLMSTKAHFYLSKMWGLFENGKMLNNWTF